MKKNNILLLFFLLSLLLASRCGEWTNPYLNKSDSKAVLKSISVKENGQVSIFSRDSIGVEVYFPEHLSRYSLRISKNRFWTDTTISAEHFNKSQARFTFSFYDTGWHNITLTSYRLEGDSVTQNFRIRATSPLKQNALRFNIGDTVELSTPAVLDNVFYIWDFHDGKNVFKEYEPTKKFFADKTIESTRGELWVVDRNHRSPSTFFIIESGLIRTLKISCENESIINDTIYTTTATFQYIGKVSGATEIKSISINNSPVDKKELTADGSTLFYKSFENVNNLSPLKIIIKVTDNLSRSISDTMVLIFNKVIEKAPPIISIIDPTKDSSIVNQSNADIYGMLANASEYKTGTIFIYVNSNLQKGYSKINNDRFMASVNLDVGWNSIECKFYEDTILQGNSLASKKIFVKFDPKADDYDPPKILYVKNGDTPLIDSSTLRISPLNLIIGFSDMSPLQSVTVNDAPAQQDTNMTYSTSFNLNHPNNRLIIKASDIFNNTVIDTFQNIRFNRKPIISGDFSKNQFIADSTINWNVIVSDPDKDTLTITALVNGKILSIGEDNTILWHPSINDTGWHTVTIEAYDRYEKTDTTFKINVLKAQNADVPVKWLTTGKDLPDTLFIGLDTLRCVLRKNPLSNLQPFKYLVEFTDNKKVIHNSSDSILKWIPTISDTGYHTIQCTITDNKNNTDVFFDFIRIIPFKAGIRFERAAKSNPESTLHSVVNVLLSRKMQTPVTVNYEVDWNRTNVMNTDIYPSSNGTLTFNPGDTVKSINLQITDDDTPESDEQIFFQLTDPSSNSYLENQSSFTYTILDDDYVSFSFSKSTDHGSESIGNATVKINLSAAYQTAVTLFCEIDPSFTTADSNDYTLSNVGQTIFFPPGQTTANMQLQITNDQLFESDEVIAFRLSSKTNNVRPGNIVLFKYTIDGNQVVNQINVDNKTFTETEYDHNIRVQFRASQTITNPVEIYYSIDHSVTTADSGKDFRFVSTNPVIFEAGTWTQFIEIKILNDTVRNEPDEKIKINFYTKSSSTVIGLSNTTEITISANAR